MAGNTATLQIRVQVDSNGNVVLTNLNQGLEQTARSGQQAAGGISAMERQMGRLVAIVGSYLSLQTAKSILTLADHYNTVVGRVKLYSESIEETKAVEEQLYRQSQVTGTSMNTNVQFFARLSAAAKSYNLSAKERLKLEETLNKTMIISGVTSGEASSILLQFSQALSKGKLDGDEFRSMAENNVVWTAKLAEQLGVTKGELIQMSRAGELTVETLFKAMKGMAESVDQEFDKMPVSIERAKQEMVNAFEYAIAGGGNAAGGISRIASGMEGLAQTIQANTPAIQAVFTAIITGADGAIRLVSGLTATVQSVAAAVTAGFGSAFQDLAAFANYFGIADEAAKGWKQTSDAAYASAIDLAEKADDNFRNVIRSSKEVKDAADAYKDSLGGTGQALLDQLDDQKKVEIEQLASIQRIINADKEGLAERDTMRSAFYRMDAEKMRQQAAEWEKSGWLESAKAAYKAADELMLKSQIVSGKYDEALKANAVAIEAVVAAQEGREVHHTKSLDKMTKAEKKAAKEREKALDELYAKFGIATQAYYEKEAQKILDSKAKFEKLGADRIQIEEEAYKQIIALSNDAYAKGDAASGQYLQRLTRGWTAAATSISTEQAELVSQFEELSGQQIAISDITDWDSIQNQVNDLLKQEEELNKDVNIDVYADTESAAAGLEAVSSKSNELDGQEVTVSADLDSSSFDSALSEVEKKAKSAGSMISEAMGGVGGAIALTADALASSSVLLDPFGDMRKSAEAAKKSIGEIQGAESSLEQMLSGLGADIDPFGELASKYGEQLQTMRDDSSTTIDDVKKLQTDAIKEVSKAQDDARKEYLSGQKDMVSEQLDSAQEALSYMQDYQKAYYGYMLDNANEYYEELKQQRDDAVEAEKEAAEERYKVEEELLEKKLALAEKEADANNKKLSALREIYQEAGVGGEEYYQLEQQNLAEQAQEWQNQGVDRVYIERWLQNELIDLRKKASDEGITGLKAYENSIISSYEKTGNFSQKTVDAEDKVARLKEQLERLKEAGTEAFFDNSSIAAQGFDDKIQAAENNINSLQTQIDALDGKNFDFVGKSTDYFSNAIANATANVANLKGQLSSLDSQINSIRQNQENVSTSGTTSTSTTSSGWFDDALKKGFGVWSFSGGGYTWDGPRSGGVDGIGGRPVLLHSNETVIDHNSPDKATISSLYDKFVAGQSGSNTDNSVKIQQLTVQVSQVSNLDTDTIIANIKRKLMRA